MNSTKDLLHQLHDPNLSTNERALLRCRLAKQLEEVGNYEAAREAIGELWENIGEAPKIDKLDQRTVAEVLLRVGTLSGWIGSTRQIEGSQEVAKNLITQSITIFESLQEFKKLAEAEMEIALCYEREGAMDEARVMFAKALARLDDRDRDLKAVALIRSAVLEKLTNRLSEALHILTSGAPLFDASQNHTLKGRFHNEYANVLRRLGAIENRSDYIDKALIEYAAGSYHFGEAGHARYQACVENNLALLYLKLNRFAEAHEHLVNAQVLFTDLGDNVHLAQVAESMARVLLGEGAVKKAERSAQLAVQMLETGGEQSLLAEALTTHGIALFRLHNEDHARADFERAIEVAERAGDLETAGVAAVTLFEQLAEQLSDDELCEVLDRAHDLLKETRDTVTLNRLLDSACRALSMIHTFRPDWATFSLYQTLRRQEARYIQMALEDANGVISRAARLLGLGGHQTLHKILRNRHKNLRNVRAAIIASGQATSLDEDTVRDQDKTASEKSLGIRILHVEDNKAVASVVKETLETQGWEVETCADGAVGLEKILSHDHYDLLLLDYDLPGVSGIELVRRARELAHRQDTPIIVLSAALGEAEAREAGANEFLHKPEDIRSLVEKITRLASSTKE